MVFKAFLTLIKDLFKENFKYILAGLVILFFIIGGNKLIRDHYLNAEKKVEDGKSVVISVLKDENKGLKDKNQTIIENSRIDDKEIVVNIDVKEGIRKDTDKARQNLSETISKINDHYKDVPVMADEKMKDTLTKQKSKEITTARINSLWDTYCAGINDDPECKGAK